jgi:cytochrome c peroxidase
VHRIFFAALGPALVVPALTALVYASGDRTPSARVLDQHKASYRRPDVVPYPSHNTHTSDRELLGRTLFFDPRLSGSGWISCATCHNPGLAWGDGMPVAIGHGMKPLGRRTPTVLNLAWAPALFWDGRAETLEEQALGPIASADEMNLNLEELARRLKQIDGYRPLFARAYPGEEISGDTVAKAIATYERGIVSAESPFDRWIAGEEHAISAAAKRGFVLFNEKARCSLCHTGWRFTDDGFHDIGVETKDLGRAKLTPDIEVTQHAFKTPTLRNVVARAPFMHNGSVATLEAVIDLYDRGGIAQRPSLSPEIKPLNLTEQERTDLLAFLHTLTSNDPEARVPTLPR